MDLFLIVLPIALVLAVGFVVAETGLVPRPLWAGVEAVSFRVLIPAILIAAIARADLSFARAGTFGIAMLIGVALAGGIVLALRYLPPLSRMAPAPWTSLFQGTTRFNGFISLALAEQALGPQGIALTGIALAVMIPTINVFNIAVLAAVLPRAHGRGVLRTIASNPIVIACVLGIALNLFGLTMPAPIAEAFDLVGRAAIGVGLLAVGAGLQIKRLLSGSGAVWTGVILRLVCVPLMFLGVAILLGLPRAETIVGVIVFAVPAASNGYMVAKAMGGDADLYADLLAWQTVLSLITLPLLLAWVG